MTNCRFELDPLEIVPLKALSRKELKRTPMKKQIKSFTEEHREFLKPENLRVIRAAGDGAGGRYRRPVVAIDATTLTWAQFDQVDIGQWRPLVQHLRKISTVREKDGPDEEFLEPNSAVKNDDFEYLPTILTEESSEPVPDYNLPPDFVKTNRQLASKIAIIKELRRTWQSILQPALAKRKSEMTENAEGEDIK